MKQGTRFPIDHKRGVFFLPTEETEELCWLCKKETGYISGGDPQYPTSSLEYLEDDLCKGYELDLRHGDYVYVFCSTQCRDVFKITLCLQESNDEVSS